MSEVVEIDTDVLHEFLREEVEKFEKKGKHDRLVAFIGGIVLTLIVVKLVS